MVFVVLSGDLLYSARKGDIQYSTTSVYILLSFMSEQCMKS
jgi:hypothetical protein